jgi:p-hydroxybenzoate 3-monooxygenase
VAHLLQRAGLAFVLLERQPASTLRARVKAGLIEHRTVEQLEPHGLAAPIRERGGVNGVCEFRADGEAHVLDYGALCGGRLHAIYPQQELVGDWAEQLVAAGGDLRFGIEVTAVEQDERAVTVRGTERASGEAVALRVEVAAICHGAAGALVTGALAGAVRSVGVSYPFRWLTLIAAVAPANLRTIYGLHPRGFAGQMRRSAALTRYMLEVPAGDGLEQWQDERIWPELRERLAAAGQPPLQQGPFVERDVLDLRVRVLSPLQHGRVFLAGDAAHLITPAGGKGMNLAIHDALELAAGLCERFGPEQDDSRLARYSQTRLPLVWRYQEFSNLMLGLLHAGSGREDSASDPAAAGFAYGLRRARLERLLGDPAYTRWFAHAYAGVDDDAT